jgi:hypothetical protein
MQRREAFHGIRSISVLMIAHLLGLVSFVNDRADSHKAFA